MVTKLTKNLAIGSAVIAAVALSFTDSVRNEASDLFRGYHNVPGIVSCEPYTLKMAFQ